MPVRVLARRFQLTHHAIFRHRRNHMSPQMVAALLAALKPSEIDLESLQRSESEGLLGSLVAQRTTADTQRDVVRSRRTYAASA
jgi:hypothetical protein